MAEDRWKVSEKELSHRFDPRELPFETTEELPGEQIFIGQERARRAIEFGLSIRDGGYNLYVCGAPGTGKNTLIKSMIRRIALKEPTPDDWCFVSNFREEGRPRALHLPAGRGRTFQRDVDQLIVTIKRALQKAFQSKGYEDERRQVGEAFSKAAEELERQARKDGFTVNFSLFGITISPLREGRPMDLEERENLDPKSREEIDQKEEKLHQRIHQFAEQLRPMQEEMNQKLDELNRRVARSACEPAFEILKGKYRDCPNVLEHIASLHQDILENFREFIVQSEAPPLTPEPQPSSSPATRYAVNLAVDNSGTEGAPVFEEVNPTYHNLIGRIDKKSRYGTLFTDLMQIKAGSLLRANGGYLILDILDLLRNPFSWEAVKRAIKGREVKIEEVADLYGFVTTTVLKPDPIPLQVRVILLGNPGIFHLLQNYDDDFSKLFKVKADFDQEQHWDDQAPLRYGRFIAWLCRAEGLLHFDRTGAAAILEQAARFAGHQEKLSLQFSEISDLVREASHWASREEKKNVSRSDVLRAVQERAYRFNLVEEKVREYIAEGTLMIDVTGTAVGQVNGLSVIDFGDFAFGRPSRITAQAFIGQAGIINIEREAKLSGKTHNKGVLILSGFLGGRYGGEHPLSLSASLCFEQSYGEVEGDSASAAETAALISALTGIPLKQGIALTGSINQHGAIQAIGGVNEKIEGFYETCKRFGLTGEQGVIIPSRNVKHLMLREEVVDAVAAGRFHVYAVSTIDEAIEILTGKPAGILLPDGRYAEGSVNAAVMDRLYGMERKRQAAAVGRRETDLPALPFHVGGNGR